MFTENRQLTLREAAQIMHVSEITARRWHLAGILPSRRFTERIVRIDEGELRAFMESRSTAKAGA